MARALRLQAVPGEVRLVEGLLLTLDSSDAFFEAAPSPQGLIQVPVAESAEIRQYRLKVFSDLKQIHCSSLEALEESTFLGIQAQFFS